MNKQTRNWIESLGYNPDQILDYGHGKLGYDRKKIADKLQQMYDDNTPVDVATFGHQIWDAMDKDDRVRPESGRALGKALDRLVPLLWFIAGSWVAVEIVRCIYGQA